MVAPRLGTALAAHAGVASRLGIWCIGAVGLFGCAADSSSDDDTAVVGGKADGVSEISVRLTWSSGMLHASESPKLASSTGSFACATDDRTADGWRLVCRRGSETLSFTAGADDRVGAGIYVRSSSTPDQRTYFHCEPTTTPPAGKWPDVLSCTVTQPRTTVDGQMVSPFASSVDGVGIFNAHEVAPRVYRSMKPFRDDDFTDLQGLGVDAVLIFKRPTASHEVDDEVAALAPLGVPAAQVVNVAFPWKDFTNFADPCRMTVRSLRQLRDWNASGKTALFHCTVGEDRTGYLAGLYRLLGEQTTARAVFDQELCEHGYSAGNPQKPYAGVVAEIDADLTPLFLKMAFKISTGELGASSLDDSVCDADPADDPAFAGDEWDATGYRCAISTRYRL